MIFHAPMLRRIFDFPKSGLRKWSLQHHSLTTGDHMEHNDDNLGNRREHKVTAARTQDGFDRLLSSMIGLPNGAHTKLAAVQHIDFYGNVTTYNIQSVKTDEGVTTFVMQADANGSVRYILPTKVLAAIDRQRTSLTKQVRSRNGRRIAEERAAAGIKPGFMQSR